MRMINYDRKIFHRPLVHLRYHLLRNHLRSRNTPMCTPVAARMHYNIVVAGAPLLKNDARHAPSAQIDQHYHQTESAAK